MYENIIKDRNITRLCHFTRTNNLPFILGDGIDSHNGIIANTLITDASFLKPTDDNRVDGKKDYICTSVQYPNSFYFSTVQKNEAQKLFSDWVIMEIDPKVINDTTLFCPVNAATKGGTLIKGGVDAFEHIFDNVVYGARDRAFERGMFKPHNIPTNIQAEVMIKNKISKEHIFGLIFVNEEEAKKEKLRLELCGIDLSNIEIKYCEKLFKNKYLEKELTFDTLPKERILK